MKNRTMRLAVLCVISLFLLNGHASAQPLGGDTEWATIGAVGNKGYDRDDSIVVPETFGRGAVNYEYRIAKHEVTTGQWMEFMNSVNGTREDGTSFSRPIIFGAWDDLSYTGPGNRFVLRPDAGPNAARLPVGGIQWRDAARYVNWLHNGKQNDSASLASGAYDTSTFGLNETSTAYTDQRSRSEGAKFWIPSLDEWMKAVHYDPSKLNEDGSTGGWWLRTNGSDEPLERGLPEDGGETSAGLVLTRDEVIPVGSYAATTPWGLLDASGSMSEMTESIFNPNSRFQFRFIDGMSAGDFSLTNSQDEAWHASSTTPFGDTWTGLRIASVPGPGTFIITSPMLVWGITRRRKI